MHSVSWVLCAGAFTDAAVAIIITIGVIPLALVEESEADIPPSRLIASKKDTIGTFAVVYWWLASFVEGHFQILSQVRRALLNTIA